MVDSRRFKVPPTGKEAPTMAYLKPSKFVTRVFNPLAMRFGLGGSVTLTVAGRRSGKPHSVPLVPLDHGGSRYLVSARGESDWVRNLRSTGTGEVRSGSGTAERFTAVEVPVGERAPIIAAYRQKAGKAVARYFTALPDPADHPVFRLERPS
jgi:deazaflavin-dependent oxidoreductase (nitroreductase family)